MSADYSKRSLLNKLNTTFNAVFDEQIFVVTKQSYDQNIRLYLHLK